MHNPELLRLFSYRIIVIARGQAPERFLRVARALFDGGIRAVEVPFDQGAPERFCETADMIRMLCEAFDGALLPGAGTVLTPAQLQIARDAGARYIVSPGTDPEIIRETKKMGLLSIPGAMTPSEICLALRAGADAVKLFPVNMLGAEYIRMLRAPLPHVPLLAVGNVALLQVRSYLDAGCQGVALGGALLRKEWIDEGAYEKITESARAFVREAER